MTTLNLTPAQAASLRNNLCNSLIEFETSIGSIKMNLKAAKQFSDANAAEQVEYWQNLLAEIISEKIITTEILEKL